eukprot:33154_1
MMKITKSLLLLATLGVHSANAINLSCIPNTVGDLTKCVLETCAVQADECLYTTTADETCSEFETSCSELMTECCPAGCKNAAANLLDCATGDLCGPFSCGARRALQAEPSPPFSRKLELGGAICVSEATAAYTSCLINNCLGADKTCGFMETDADNCQDIAEFCPTVNACCPKCQESLESLLECSTGDLCGDFDCDKGTVDTMDTTTTPAGGGATPDVMTALGASFAMLFLA